MYVEQDFLLEEAREVQFIGSQVELVLKDKTEVLLFLETPREWATI